MTTRQIATFFLGDTLLGVDILLVKEVYRHMTISPIPDAPEHLLGLMNLRGRVVTVIDLNVCLNRSQNSQIDNGRLLIFKTQEEITDFRPQFYNKSKNMESQVEEEAHLLKSAMGEDIVGFLIDRMDDVITVEYEAILPPPPNLVEVDNDLINGVIKQGKRLVILLDVPSVLNRVMQASSEK